MVKLAKKVISRLFILFCVKLCVRLWSQNLFGHFNISVANFVFVFLQVVIKQMYVNLFIYANYNVAVLILLYVLDIILFLSQ